MNATNQSLRMTHGLVQVHVKVAAPGHVPVAVQVEIPEVLQVEMVVLLVLVGALVAVQANVQVVVQAVVQVTALILAIGFALLAEADVKMRWLAQFLVNNLFNL